MKRPRFSIKGLGVLVLCAAVGCAVLSYAARLWAGPLIALMACVLASATLGALLRRWPGRAFWLGFSAFGWSYFFLAFSSPRVRLSLPTTPPLVRLYDVFSGAGIARPEDVAPFILRLHDYLKVGHALIALAAALVGGIVLGCLAGWLGRAARPASSGPG